MIEKKLTQRTKGLEKKNPNIIDKLRGFCTTYVKFLTI